MAKRVEFTRAFEYWAAGVTADPKPAGNLFHNPRFVVYRPAPGFSLPDDFDGLWVEVSRLSPFPPLRVDPNGATATATPAGRYEVRADGVWAEVYEVRW